MFHLWFCLILLDVKINLYQCQCQCQSMWLNKYKLDDMFACACWLSGHVVPPSTT